MYLNVKYLQHVRHIHRIYLVIWFHQQEDYLDLKHNLTDIILGLCLNLDIGSFDMGSAFDLVEPISQSSTLQT